MNNQTFNTIIENKLQEIRRTLVIKNGEYAGATEDRLSNFKRAGTATGLLPLEVALVYMNKHYDALCNYVKDAKSGNTRERSEPIQGRITDLMNYCLLVEALIEDTVTKLDWNTLLAGPAAIGGNSENDLQTSSAVQGSPVLEIPKSTPINTATGIPKIYLVIQGTTYVVLVDSATRIFEILHPQFNCVWIANEQRFEDNDTQEQWKWWSTRK